MKKRIGILTLIGNFNYGNRLQNYALLTFLKSMGFDAETIVIKNNKPKSLKQNLKSGNILSIIVRSIRTGIKKSKMFLDVQYRKEMMNEQICIEKRNLAFQEYANENIEVSSFTIDENIMDKPALLKEIDNRYDSVFVGSDQVWNPFSRFIFPDLYFLPFVAKGKRTAFAASFGFTEIPNKKMKPLYKKALKNMDYLSVREESGMKLIRDLSGRTAQVLLDPTMLISKNHWLQVAEKSLYRPQKKYLVSFFLGKITNEYQEAILKISDLFDLEIVYLNDFKYQNLYSTSPSEFLDFISSAEFVLTDSFHGAVFSIIFEVPFLAVDRVDGQVNMITRVVNLVNTLGISNCYTNDISTKRLDNIMDVDFNPAKKVIETNIRISKDFVTNSLRM